MPNIMAQWWNEREREKEIVSEGEAQAPRETCKVVSVMTSHLCDGDG